MTDADLMHQIGELLRSRFGDSILTLDGLRSATRLHLLNVLRREVSDVIGVNAVDVRVEAQREAWCGVALAACSADSSSVLFTKLKLLPLPSLHDHLLGRSVQLIDATFSLTQHTANE